MPSLYRRSNIFMDVRNVMIATDAIVAHRWNLYMKAHPKDLPYFTAESEWMRKPLIFQELKTKIMATKQNKNFLLDYFDWNLSSMTNEPVNAYEICEKTYKKILGMEPLPKNDILLNQDFEPTLTGIGASLKNLIKDVNLNTLHLYLDDTIPKSIEKKIVQYLEGSQKLFFVRGDKKEYFKHNLFDSYFFEDTYDVDAYLTKRHPQKVEVLVPASANNLTVVEWDGNTGLRLIATDHLNSYYDESINANVFTISLPI